MKLPKITKEVADQFKKDLKKALHKELRELCNEAGIVMPLMPTKGDMVEALTNYINKIS